METRRAPGRKRVVAESPSAGYDLSSMATRRKATSPKTKDSTANLGFEAKLWLAADKLRNNMDAAEPSGARQPAREGSPEGQRGGAEQYKHVVLGRLNSRMKDFFDLWMIARQFDFQGNELATAVRKTFENRNTDIDADPVALTSSFTADEKTEMQWKAFIKRMRIEHYPGSLDEIREPLRQFLIPIAEALVAGETFEAKWIAPGGWQ